MSSRASGGALAACLIVAAIVGFAGGAYIGSRSGDDGPAGDPQSTATETSAQGDPATPLAGLTLTADPTSVAANDLVAISGTIEPVEAGVQVSVQRRVGDGEWQDFPNSDRPITLTTRADGTFSGSVATGQAGQNGFRVVNLGNPEMISNEVGVVVE